MDDKAKLLYRRALGAFATGVALITVADGEDVVALTVNSFTSASLDPPLVLYGLGAASDRGRWFREAERFVVNVMGVEDGALAAGCARRGQYRLPADRLDRSREGFAAVDGALTRLFCRAHAQVPLGDHTMIVGQVVDFDTRPGDGLSYFRGRFGQAVAPEDS